MEITSKTFNDISTSVDEGIVLRGCEGDLNEWYNGVIGTIVDFGIPCSSSDFNSPYAIVTTGGRIDLVMEFSENCQIDITRLAMWRLSFGDCSWISDYIDNYRDQHEQL